MRRLWIMLLAGLLAAATAAPAAMAKGKPAPPEHPPGLSCAEAVIYYEATHRVITWAPQTDGDTLEVTLEKAAPLVCVDVTNAAPGSFTLQVIDRGVAHSLTANLRDSHPGDFCPSGDTTRIDLNTTSSLTFSGVPAAVVNSCGIEYSEGVLDEYGNLIDQIPTQTGDPDPLALAVWDSPTRATVRLTVTYHTG